MLTFNPTQLCHSSSVASQALFSLRGDSLEVKDMWLSTDAPTVCPKRAACRRCGLRSPIPRTRGYTVGCPPKTRRQDGRGFSCVETGRQRAPGVLDPAALSWGWGGGSWWPGVALPPGPLDLAPPGRAQFIFTPARHLGHARPRHLCRVLGTCPRLEGTWFCLPDL